MKRKSRRDDIIVEAVISNNEIPKGWHYLVGVPPQERWNEKNGVVRTLHPTNLSVESIVPTQERGNEIRGVIIKYCVPRIHRGN